MKTKSFLLGLVALFCVLTGLTFGQTAPSSFSPPAPVGQKLTVSHVAPDGYTATVAVVSAPRFVYSPTTATVTAQISIVYYKDAAAITAHLRPADYKTYSLTAAEVASVFTPQAVAASSPLKVGVGWLLAKPDFAGATAIP